MLRYPWQLPVRLSARVENHQVAEAHRDLDQLLAIIGEKRSDSLSVRKLRCAQAISHCTRGALRGGASSNALVTETMWMLHQVAGQRTWRAVCALMHACVDKLLAQVRPNQRTSVESYVAWMRRDMRAELESPKSLAQYAEAAGLSIGHLSRCFAAIVGRPFRGELRRLRIETAGRLLREKDLKVSTVARMIGLKDSSQFIADFRSEMGQTPAAYRESHRNCGRSRIPGNARTERSLA